MICDISELSSLDGDIAYFFARDRSVAFGVTREERARLRIYSKACVKGV